MLQSPVSAPYDQVEFSDRTGGDAELQQELVALLCRDLPALQTTLAAAIGAGDAKNVERGAHAIKGAVANFAARNAVEIAQSIENMGRQANLSSVAPTMARLDVELRRLVDALKQMIGSTTGQASKR